jgi:hypothetical protein
MRVKNENMKQEKKLQDQSAAQPALIHQKTEKAKIATPHSIAPTFGAVLLGSYRSASPCAVKFCGVLFEFVCTNCAVNRRNSRYQIKLGQMKSPQDICAAAELCPEQRCMAFRSPRVTLRRP